MEEAPWEWGSFCVLLFYYFFFRIFLTVSGLSMGCILTISQVHSCTWCNLCMGFNVTVTKRVCPIVT